MAFFALPRVATGRAQLAVQAAERERWNGKVNLGGEMCSKRTAMDGEFTLAAGEFNAVVWWYSGTDWAPTPVLGRPIGRIEDVAISNATAPSAAPDSILREAPAALYGQK